MKRAVVCGAGGLGTKTQLEKDLRHWLADPDLITVRDPAQLSLLPDDEKTRWRELWNEVERRAKSLQK